MLKNIKLFYLFNLYFWGFYTGFYSTLWIYIVNLITDVYNKSYYICNEVTWEITIQN